MPADDFPSFHWRPTTGQTFLCASVSIRQTPTTLRNDLGSAPTVSSEKSTLLACCAAANDTRTADPIAVAATIVLALRMNLMTDLRFDRWIVDAWRTAAPPPCDHGR